MMFGALLRKHRRASGLTQEALAEQAGVSVRGIQHLEAGDALPYRATAHALAHALALSPEEQTAFVGAAAAPKRALGTSDTSGRGAHPALADDFAERVHDALTHLYDPVYLQSHPLAQQLCGADLQVPPSRAGRALRQRLLDALALFRPEPSTPQTSPAWRAYRLLHFRYVESQSPSEVQDRLGLSKTHYYREHARALAAFVSLLAERWRAGVDERSGSPVNNGADRTNVASAEVAAEDLAANLPRQLTSFVGRAVEREEIEQVLGAHRLVTLVGPGGIGKTRLALQVAAEVTPQYAHGVWFVDLAPLADQDAVVAAVASAVGVQADGRRPLLDTLVSVLRTKRLLLVMDNCEHVVGACAKVADVLLKACSEVRILATGREPLGVVGEALWRVPPLHPPESRGEGDSGAAIMMQALAQNESVRLFLDRAMAVQPHFTLTPQNAAAVAQVCRLLDGLPLAIELAAARVRVLTPAQLLERLDDCFRFLRSSSRMVPPRQQTLQATLEWSYDLLTASERTLLNRLSVFAGGWTIEAAEAVCSGDGIAETEVLDLLTALVDKSLVVADAGVVDGTEVTRYRLLETVRQYGRQRLEATEGGSRVRDRLAAYFVDLAEKAEPGLLFGEQVRWLDRLDAEHENVRAALRWLEERGDTEAGLRLTASLLYWWLIRSSRVEGLTWIDRLLRRAVGLQATQIRAKALDAAGLLAWLVGQRAASEAYAEEHVHVARALGDRRSLGYALYAVGRNAGDRCDYASATTSLQESLAIARDLGNRHLEAWALFFLGSAALHTGDYTTPQTLREQCRAIFEALGDLFGLGNALNALAGGAAALGDRDAMLMLAEERLRVATALRHHVGESQALDGLAYVAEVDGDLAAAHALRIRSLRIKWDTGIIRGVAVSLEALTCLASKTQAFARSVRLAAAADAVRTLVDLPRKARGQRQLDECLAPALAALNQEEQALAHAEGSAMSLEQAVAYVMADGEAHSVSRKGFCASA
jgi:predicted ATPase/transcriptional regulator with XRE-family HTH domain